MPMLASRVNPIFRLCAPSSFVALTWMLATRLMLLSSRDVAWPSKSRSEPIPGATQTPREVSCSSVRPVVESRCGV